MADQETAIDTTRERLTGQLADWGVDFSMFLKELVAGRIRKLKAIVKKVVRIYLIGRMKKTESLHYSLWNLGTNDDGILTVGGCDVVLLASEYGTPLHIINEEEVLMNCARFSSAFSESLDRVELFFSYKTNPVPGMIRIVHSEGIGAEVTSETELRLALRLGVPPKKIIYDGRGKSTRSLTWAIEQGIRLINIDSFNEIDTISTLTKKLNKQIDVGIRVITGLGWSGPFGFSAQTKEAFSAVKKIHQTEGLRLKGLHLHLGTSLKDVNIYLQALDVTFRLIYKLKNELNIEIAYLDIGGGFSTPSVRSFSSSEIEKLERYHVPLPTPDMRDQPRASDYASAIGKRINELCINYRLSVPIIFVEPGRVLSSSAQILLLKIIDLKQRDKGTKFAILDGSINIAHPLKSEFREAFLANQMFEEERELYTIVGPTCNPDDVLYPAKFLPKIQVGDYIAIMDAGAYFVSFADNFCFPRPPIAIVSKAGHRLTKKRETFDYIYSNDIMTDLAEVDL